MKNSYEVNLDFTLPILGLLVLAALYPSLPYVGTIAVVLVWISITIMILAFATIILLMPRLKNSDGIKPTSKSPSSLMTKIYFPVVVVLLYHIGYTVTACIFAVVSVISLVTIYALKHKLTN